MWFFMLELVTKASEHPSAGHLKSKAGSGLETQNYSSSISKNGHSGLLVWFLPAMAQLMFGTLITSTEALVTVCTGKWFLTLMTQFSSVYWPLIFIHV